MHTWTVPGYTEVSELHRTGSGRTALATHTATGALVAIRYLADEYRADEAWLARFRDDTRRLATVDSPHLVGLYEYVESADGAATVREHVDGVALPELLAAGRLRPEAALTVLKGALSGLLAAHAAGVRQCRFDPAGVLVDRHGRTRLTDGPAEVPATAPADDVAAAFAAFVGWLPKGLPKPLRGLSRPGAAGDGPALLAELEAAARAGYGPDWEAAGHRRLARDVAGRPRPGRR